MAFPDYFCRCLGKFEELLRENSSFIREMVELKSEIEETNRIRENLLEEIGVLKERIENFVMENQRVLKENQKLLKENQDLKGEINEFLSKKETINEDFIDFQDNLKIKSMDYEFLDGKTHSFEINFMKKSPKSSDNRELELRELRNSVRKKTRVITRKYSNLFNEIEKSLKNGDNIQNEGFLEVVDRFSSYKLRFSMEMKSEKNENVGEKTHKESDDIREGLIEKEKGNIGCWGWVRKCLRSGGG